MIPLTRLEAGEALGLPEISAPVSGVSIDTRRLAPGELFVAIRGENFDGHDFVAQAFERGASGAVVRRDWYETVSNRLLSESGLLSPSGLPAERVYPVDDTVRSLLNLAAAVRTKSSARVVAVTGSMGKTGTKDLLRAMAEQVCRTVATASNQNNEIGVPLTLLELAADTEFAVVELGMRGRGQIAELAQAVRPDVAVITNVAPVHLELLGSLEEIAQAKLELFSGLSREGVRVIPAGTPLLETGAGGEGRVLRFAACPGRVGIGARARLAAGVGPGRATGTGMGSDVPARIPGNPAPDVALLYESISQGGSRVEVKWPQGKVELEVPWTGQARMENAAAAAAACLGAGLPLERCLEGLPSAAFSPFRGEEAEGTQGALILNDSYNANPVAVQVALDGLVERARLRGARSVAVLGDMLELGPEAESYHRNLGFYASEVGVEVLLAVGSLSEATVEGYAEGSAQRRGFRSYHASDAEEAKHLAARLVRPGDVVLVKGSRGVGLERVARHLTGEADG